LSLHGVPGTKTFAIAFLSTFNFPRTWQLNSKDGNKAAAPILRGLRLNLALYGPDKNELRYPVNCGLINVGEPHHILTVHGG
jgi:hypothetical protein